MSRRRRTRRHRASRDRRRGQADRDVGDDPDQPGALGEVHGGGVDRGHGLGRDVVAPPGGAGLVPGPPGRAHLPGGVLGPVGVPADGVQIGAEQPQPLGHELLQRDARGALGQPDAGVAGLLGHPGRSCSTGWAKRMIRSTLVPEACATCSGLSPARMRAWISRGGRSWPQAGGRAGWPPSAPARAPADGRRSAARSARRRPSSRARPRRARCARRRRRAPRGARSAWGDLQQGFGAGPGSGPSSRSRGPRRGAPDTPGAARRLDSRADVVLDAGGRAVAAAGAQPRQWPRRCSRAPRGHVLETVRGEGGADVRPQHLDRGGRTCAASRVRSGSTAAPPTWRRSSAMSTGCQRRGPDGHGLWHDGPVALAHRRLKIIDLSDAGAQPMVDAELGLVSVFNGCIYNYRQLRDELRGARLPVLLHLRHRGDRQGLPPLGCGLRRPLHRHVRVRHPGAGHRPADPGPRPAGHQAAVPGPDPGPAAVRLVAAGAAGRRRRRHLDRPGRAEPLHDVPRGGAGAADHPVRASRKLPPATVRTDRAGRPRAPT